MGSVPTVGVGWACPPSEDFLETGGTSPRAARRPRERGFPLWTPPDDGCDGGVVLRRGDGARDLVPSPAAMRRPLPQERRGPWAPARGLYIRGVGLRWNEALRQAQGERGGVLRWSDPRAVEPSGVGRLPIAMPQLWGQDVCRKGLNPTDPSHDITLGRFKHRHNIREPASGSVPHIRPDNRLCLLSHGAGWTTDRQRRRVRRREPTRSRAVAIDRVYLTRPI